MNTPCRDFLMISALSATNIILRSKEGSALYKSFLRKEEEDPAYFHRWENITQASLFKANV